mgnify:FL=1
MDIGVNEKNEIFQMNGIVTNVFDEVMNRYNNKNSLSNIWEEVIKKIYNYGSKLSGHTKVIDLKNGILLIESDHPGWNQILQNNKEFILKGLKFAIKDVEIKSLAFRVKGRDFNLYENSEDIAKSAKEQFNKKIEEEEKKLEKMGYSEAPKEKEIHPEVKKLFEGILDS